jgi:uncharacterized protein involved in response to NO
MQKLQESYFLSQPHQSFFLLGIINAIFAMLLFGLSYKGIILLESMPAFFHSYTLAFLVFTNLFFGFLFTTFPRFNQTAVISKSYYSNIFFVNAAASLLFFLGALFNSSLLEIAMIILFSAQIFGVKKLREIYKEGKAADKSDSFWILNALYFGLFGHLLFLLTQIFSLPILFLSAVNISFYLYLIFLAFSVGQRMIPFFSHSWAQKDKNFVRNIFILFIIKSITSSAELKVIEMVVDILLALYMLKEFLRWDFHPLKSPAILWVLHLAIFWLPVAFGLSAISLAAELFLDTSFYFLNIHLLALGFLTTVLVGFGTRVILGHSGQTPHADKFATSIFLFIQFIVVLRALFSINIAFGWNLEFLFDIAITGWILLFLLWGGRYAKVLLFGNKN